LHYHQLSIISLYCCHTNFLFTKAIQSYHNKINIIVKKVFSIIYTEFDWNILFSLDRLLRILLLLFFLKILRRVVGEIRHRIIAESILSVARLVSLIVRVIKIIIIIIIIIFIVVIAEIIIPIIIVR